MITIIDYGLGNIRAFVNVYERLNIKTKIARIGNDIKGATKIILPGVGAFDYAMSQLNASGMRHELEKQVLENNIPVVGICVGMQILAKSSDEGKLPGLGWIDAKVQLFDTSKIPYKTRLPHMGWNSISPVKTNPLLSGFNNESRFYFLHSYYFVCNNKDDIISTTEYGISYASAINSNNIYGIQFHPEKSHSNGIQLLNNFAKI
ncbi:MAG: imidazole glycerol phosphate synthase subunit HisH [Bacteroidetes bacterium HGW-Bacteroidetes-5]|jgi:glutamine amidotransferase|nr:MAG: imidazole glycerol phosphate synthase subunit HisH [Bacteroidetes bacterium HGW-Bacteroidetes-5]